MKVLALVLWVALHHYVCGIDFVWDGTTLQGWIPLGAASKSFNENGITLTNSYNQTSNVWCSTRQHLSYGFQFNFALQCKPPIIPPGASGFSFIINNLGNYAFGNDSNPNGLGYDFESNLAIEFDTYKDHEANDPNFNHVAVMIPLLDEPNGPDHSLHGTAVPVAAPICDGAIHNYQITYLAQESTFTVSMSGNVILTTYVDPYDIIPLDSVYIGFGATTSGESFQTVNLFNATYYEASVITSISGEPGGPFSSTALITLNGNFDSYSGGFVCLFVFAPSSGIQNKIVNANSVSVGTVKCPTPTLPDQSSTITSIVYVLPDYVTNNRSCDVGIVYYFQGFVHYATDVTCGPGASYLNLSWTDDDFPVFFSIQYGLSENPNANFVYIGPNFHVTIPNLEPNTNYVVSILTFNYASDPLEVYYNCTTLGGAPEQIQDLSTVEIDSTSSLLNWSLPDDNGSPIQKVIIQYSTNKNGPFKSVSVDPSVTSYKVTDLPIHTKHYFQITTANEMDTAPFSDLLEVTTLSGCGDGVCDDGESCLTCKDCWCHIAGWKLETHSKSTNTTTTELHQPRNGFQADAYSSYKFHGYVTIPTFAIANFRLMAPEGIKSQATLYIDKVPIVGGAVTSDNIDYNFSQPLKGGEKHHIMVDFQSEQGGNFTLLWDQANALSPDLYTPVGTFYSSSECGDAVCSVDETAVSCPEDCAGGSCGDGICSKGENSTSCLVDCYASFYHGSDCAYVVPQSNIQAGIPLGDDSLGLLISNNMLWTLPGVEHMTHGVNIFTGSEAIAPLFLFTYCSGNESRTLQDSYRGYIYQIPEQIDADAYPSCTFSATTQTYSSSYAFTQDRAEQTSVSASLDVGYDGFGFTAAASLAFSQEKTSSSVSKSEQAQDGSLSITSVNCYTSKVQMGDNPNLHPSFLEALTIAVDSDDFVAIIEKYGSHYYQQAELGGKLSMTMSVSHSLSSFFSSESLEQMATYSFSASVSGWGASGSAAGDYAESVIDNREQQEAFENKTSKSSIITYGGAPGSFGPAGGSSTDAPGNWGDWAQTVDLLPVPIDFTLDRIYNILPERFQAGWLAGEQAYYADLAGDYGYTNEFLLELNILKSTANVGPLGLIVTGSLHTTTPILILANGNNTVDVNTETLYEVVHASNRRTTVRFRFREGELGTIQEIQICTNCALVTPANSGTVSAITFDSAYLVDFNAANQYTFAPTTSIPNSVNFGPIMREYSTQYQIIFNAFPATGSHGAPKPDLFSVDPTSIQIVLVGSTGRFTAAVISTEFRTSIDTSATVRIVSPIGTRIGKLQYMEIAFVLADGHENIPKYWCSVRNIRVVDYDTYSNTLVYMPLPEPVNGFQLKNYEGVVENVRAPIDVVGPNIHRDISYSTMPPPFTLSNEGTVAMKTKLMGF